MTSRPDINQLKDTRNFNIHLRRNSKMMSKDFVFGVATSAFQIEGATDADGRVDSIWDTFCRQKRTIKNKQNGDVACEHYYQWKKDIDLISFLGVEAYRLSIAWPRIIKNSDREINTAGLKFYRKIIDYCKQKGIKVYLTLYHWDLPEFLQQQGGWCNRKTAQEFAFFVDVIASHFGDDISHYVTINEPWCAAILGHLHGIHAPGIKDRKSAYHAAHHLLLAHGLATNKIRQHTKIAKVGIALNMAPHYSHSNSENDIKSTRYAEVEMNELFIEPLINARYPEYFAKEYQNLMPKNYQKDLEFISVANDFLGINYYTCNTVSESNDDSPFNMVADTGREKTAMGWDIYPEGLSDLLVSLNQRYQLPPILILENGIALDDRVVNGEINDAKRIEFLQSHIDELDNAMQQGGCRRRIFCLEFIGQF